MPTHREWLEQSPLFGGFGFDLGALEERLEALNLVLLIKAHPLDLLPRLDSSSRIRVRESDTFFELEPLLAGVDGLITDYSSVVVDFLLCNKPVLLLAFDVEEYNARRGLYFTPQDLGGGPVATSWGEVHSMLDRFRLDQYAAERAELTARLHHHLDGRSCERVYYQCMRLVGL